MAATAILILVGGSFRYQMFIIRLDNYFPTNLCQFWSSDSQVRAFIINSRWRPSPFFHRKLFPMTQCVINIPFKVSDIQLSGSKVMAIICGGHYYFAILDMEEIPVTLLVCTQYRQLVYWSIIYTVIHGSSAILDEYNN